MLQPDDHWSCFAHLNAEDMLKSAIIEEKNFKQPYGRGRQPIRANIFMSTGRPHLYGHLFQVKNISLQSLTLYTSFHDLRNVHSRRSGTDNAKGQNFDVNRNLLSLRPFATSLKKISLKSDFIHFCFMILYTYIAPGQGLTILVHKVLMSIGTSCHFGHLLQVSKKSLKSDFIQFFFS